MARVFFISDLHLGHRNVMEFTDRGFECLDHMHDTIIELWNQVVTKRDLTYVLGDVCFDHQYLPILSKLNGVKNLILGNHDKFKKGELFKYFNSVHGCRSYKGNILTHIPIHPSEFYRWRYNIHGHLHTYDIDDPRYINVNIDRLPLLQPIPFDDLIKQHELKIAY